MKSIFKYVIIIAFMIISFTYNLMRPSALTTETIYANSSNCTLSDSNKYKNVSSNGTISTNSINTTYNGKSYGMQFYFAEDMITTKVYQLKITFMADDLLPRVNESFIELITYDTSCESDYATILSIEKNTTSGNATTLQINFIPSMTSNKARILLGSSSGPIQITGETTFGIKSVQIGDRESQGNEQIIINQNQNTQDIINNQNQNTQDLIDSNKACSSFDKTNIKTDNYYLYSGVEQTEPPGTELSSTSWGITDYISIDKDSDIYTMQTFTGYTFAGLCFYNTNKTLISCINTTNTSSTLTIPDNSSYVRFSINKSQNKPQFKVCRNGNQAISDNLNDLNDSLNNDDVDNSDYADFFSNFSTNTFGLTSIITAPLNLIQSLTSSSCSDLELPLPYLNNKKITLPCMSSIYSNYFGSFFTIYQTITFGIVAYWVIVRIFNQVKDFKNPDHDEIEVVDL